MEYRKLPHGEEQISALGMGSSYIGAAPEKEICETVTMAVENGVNYFDLAAADANPFPAYGKALAGMRDKVYFQIHFGANYETGKYNALWIGSSNPCKPITLISALSTASINRRI